MAERSCCGFFVRITVGECGFCGCVAAEDFVFKYVVFQKSLTDPHLWVFLFQ